MVESQARIPSDGDILLIEDNADDVELALYAFAKCKLPRKVLVVRDGESALDLLFRRGAYSGRDAAHPNLILLDLHMPGLSGLEVLRQLRENPTTKRLPIVIMSHSTDSRDIIHSYDYGANSYLHKPTELATFTGLVDQLSAYWMGVNFPPPQ